jgi:hypothetical protein
MGYDAGMKSENYFASLLNAKGLSYFFDDQALYDFRVGVSPAKAIFKIEVKSACLSVREGHKRKKQYYNCGYFTFNKDQIGGQHDENTYFCFVVRWREQFLLYGFVYSKNLQKKRHVSIHEVHSTGLMDFDEFVSIISK